MQPGGTALKDLDELTLARARQGDSGACRSLVERYQRPVFAILSRMLRPSGRGNLVEDLAQETFLRVFRSLSDFRPDGPARLSTWILTIASRLAIDELRRTPLRPVDQSAVVSVPATEQTDAAAVRSSLQLVLEKALAELEPDQRAAFLLRHYHELSHQEIAQCCDIQIGTVKSRIARARAALSEALSEVQDE
jgi:RNA polymerase sigma-70 factor (ECF subfamily)